MLHKVKTEYVVAYTSTTFKFGEIVKVFEGGEMMYSIDPVYVSKVIEGQGGYHVDGKMDVTHTYNDELVEIYSKHKDVNFIFIIDFKIYSLYGSYKHEVKYIDRNKKIKEILDGGDNE